MCAWSERGDLSKWRLVLSCMPEVLEAIIQRHLLNGEVVQSYAFAINAAAQTPRGKPQF